MELKRLFMKRFLSVGDEPVEIIFPTGPGVTHIKGLNLDVSSKSSNGAGKSTIIEGIVFALKGKTLRNLTNDGVLHNGSEGGCLVELEYDNVKILRTIKPNSVKVWVDGVEKTTASMVETKKLIDQIVGLNFEALANILIFGQHNIISFLDAGEPEKREIIENLMNLKEYNSYEEVAREKLREVKTTVKVKTEAHAIESVHLSEQQQLLANQEELLKRHLADVETQINVLNKRIASAPDINSLRAEWDQYNVKLAEKKKLSDELIEVEGYKAAATAAYNEAWSAMQNDTASGRQPLIEKINSTQQKFGVLEQRKRDAETQILDPIIAQGKEVKEELQRLELARERATAALVASENWELTKTSLNSQRIRLQSDLDAIFANKQECPTCAGIINAAQVEKITAQKKAELAAIELQIKETIQKESDELSLHKHQYENIWASWRMENDSTVAKREELVEKYTTEKATIDADYADTKSQLDAILQQAQKSLDNFEINMNSKHQPIIDDALVERDRWTTKVGNVELSLSKFAQLQPPEVALDEIGRFQAQIENDKKAVEQLELSRTKNPYVEMITSLQKSIKAAEDKVEATHLQIKESEKLVPYYEFWQKAMGKEGIKSFIIDQIVPTLNDQIEYWMQLMYQNSISVKFDKYLNVSLINNGSGHEMVFGQGSGGERRRIDLAVMLGFRQVMKLTTGKDPNIVFFDEVAENLDDEGVYRLHDAILDISKNSHVYVISHNPTLSQLLQSVTTLNVIKQGGCMKIAC